jgi:hypothetical protein
MSRAAAAWIIVLLALTAPARAQSPAAESAAPHERPPAPVLSHQTHWTKPLLFGAAALFAAALLFGLLYRPTLPREMLPAHSHDEPPGSSHRHGESGTEE